MAEPLQTDDRATRLAALEAGQAAMNQALGLMLDTLQQQMNLLREIAASVRDEPGPSPIMQSLDELTSAVVDMGAGIETVSRKLDTLPDAIGAALDSDPAPRQARTADTGA